MHREPTAFIHGGTHALQLCRCQALRPSPPGGLSISSGGRGQPSCSCYHPQGPKFRGWHQVPNAIGGTRSSPSTGVARGAAGSPGWMQWGSSTCSAKPRRRARSGGSWHPPAHTLPFTLLASMGYELGVPGSPQHPLCCSWGRGKGQKPRGFGSTWLLLQHGAAPEQDGEEQRGGSVRPPGSPARWC